MPMIGGDLGAMDALARRFDAAGAHFRTQSDELTRRVEEALAGFASEMAAFAGDARVLDEEIGRAIAGLRAQADATAWTGAHRQQQETALAALEADIAGVRRSIDALVTETSGAVSGELSASLREMQAGAGRAGHQAELIAASFARNVARQRAAFDLVMNG